MLGKKIECPACRTKNILEPLEARQARERAAEESRMLESQHKRDLERLKFLQTKIESEDITNRETPRFATPGLNAEGTDVPEVSSELQTSGVPAPVPTTTDQTPQPASDPARAQDLVLIEDFANAALIFAYLLAFLGVLGMLVSILYDQPLKPLAALASLMVGLTAFVGFKYLGELSRLLLHIARAQDRLLGQWSAHADQGADEHER